MSLAPRQSFFVIFPKTGAGAPPAASKMNFPQAKPVTELEGPWQVSFDPKWGGPRKVEFASLEDWTKRPEEGIKYYSGTAVYKKTFDVDSSALRNPQSAIYLDLGKVKNLARVRLNGKDLGIVWCAPWRVEVSKALKAGKNKLQIEVVNLWANRIIGDEQIPADAEYVEWNLAENMKGGGYDDGVNGYALKDLPDWLIKGKRRPSKRYTFVNWQFYNKNAPLLESGLLGPVRLTGE